MPQQTHQAHQKATHKNAATSPITVDAGGAAAAAAPADKRSLPKGAHVRFSEVDEAAAASATGKKHFRPIK